MQFDIEEFYPSISKELKAITYAKTFVNTGDEKLTPYCIQESLCYLKTKIYG